MAKEKDGRLASSFERTARVLEVVTVALVVLVSPLSFVVSLPLGVAPQTWLSIWLRYVFVFVVLAIAIALVGFAAASTYRVRAKKSRRSIQKS